MGENQTIRLAIEESIRFLESGPDLDASGEYSRRKWDGAWWHMAALYEMGEVKRIPESAIVRAKYWLQTQVWQIRKLIFIRKRAPLYQHFLHSKPSYGIQTAISLNRKPSF
ncbi:hypothetical protein FHS18_004567 [Paenibacillus phyllosphaerae]|uniref:Uncharacterized protein n=1 Tax=Paenibacillus phyllosphaerae TaxID=274593 RepID=A0A7W5FPL0_9BACL|nr:hypothetical protein [Paenibacillus phyllosphaerae]MBB3112466.1 hypothetical protein [Paenibacillus phyllosphaerae]